MFSMSRVWRSPDSVQRTVWRMARMYTGGFLLTYGPLVVYLIAGDSVPPLPAMVIAEVALCFKSLNGCLNTTVCYVLSSRYTLSKIEESLRMSRDVVPSTGQEAGGNSPVREELRGVVSFHVDFRSIQRADVHPFEASDERIDATIHTIDWTQSTRWT